MLTNLNRKFTRPICRKNWTTSCRCTNLPPTLPVTSTNNSSKLISTRSSVDANSSALQWRLLRAQTILKPTTKSIKVRKCLKYGKVHQILNHICKKIKIPNSTLFQILDNLNNNLICAMRTANLSIHWPILTHLSLAFRLEVNRLTNNMANTKELQKRQVHNNPK